MSFQRYTCVAVLFAITFLTVLAEDVEDEKVSDRIPKFLTTPHALYVNRGDQVALECKVDVLEPFISLWMKGKDILTTGNKIFKAPKGGESELKLEGTTLTILSFTDKDEGQYSCVISSNPQQTLTHEVYLKVPAQINETFPAPGDVAVGLGDDVTLNCSANGRPPPTIHWTNEDTTRKPWISEDGTTVTIKNIQHEDGGRYTCVAKNEVGQDKVTFAIKVFTAPSKVEILSPPESDQKTSYTVKFKTESAKQIREFKLLTRQIGPGTTPKAKPAVVVIPAEQQTPPHFMESYTLSGLKPASTYEVEITARNDFGWSTASHIFKFTTLGAAMSDQTPATSRPGTSIPDKVPDTQSGLKNDSNKASTPQVQHREKIVAIMTIVILVAFF